MADSGEVTKKPRTLVLCFDGTASEYDDTNTNVVDFFALLKKTDSNEQLCYYQAGVGTFFSPGVVSPLFQWVAKILDEAFAWYLDVHVMDGYRYLMQNYRVGDRVCLFGFSRGAYTARALAGVLHKIGLLPKDNLEQMIFAYKLYKRKDKAGIALCTGFKREFCRAVKVDFMGVWDTVSSVGIMRGCTLPFTNSNKSIKVFRHALSLDEHRSKFRPNSYHRPSPDEAGAVLDPEEGSPVLSSDAHSSFKTHSPDTGHVKRLKILRKVDKGRTANIYVDVVADDDEGPSTDVMEVWFSGCHGDVGGGAVSNATTHKLANVSLRWMVREVMASQCGVLFDDRALARACIPLLVFPSITCQASPEEEALDKVDAVQPLNDALKRNLLWWLLEIIPLSYSFQDAQGIWHRSFGLHLGKGRHIEDLSPNFHVTVKERMADTTLNYSPRAVWRPGSEVYVS